MDRIARGPGAAAWLATLALLTPRSSAADESAGVSLHGFLLADYAARATGKRIPASRAADFLFAEEGARVDLALEARSVDAAAQLRLDAFHDAVAARANLAVREAYLDYRTGPLDVRLGRQLLGWGVGDLAFINDVFPKDYAAFFVGRPIEYLKVPSDALRATLGLGSVSADVVAIPFFAPDELPGPDRFSYGFGPISGIAPRRRELPALSFANTELAARLTGSVWRSDLALYAYRGFFHAPSPGSDGTLFFPPLSVYGASLQRNLLGGVVSAEAGYLDSRQDRAGSNPLLPNSSARWLAGFQRELLSDLTFGLQYLGDLMMSHGQYLGALAAGLVGAARYRQTVTFRATVLRKNQTLRFSFLAFYGVTERDFLIVPEGQYQIHDRLTVVLGLNLFGGARSDTTFGTFRDDTNLYAWSRFTF
jgi:hypothetical protein